MWFMGDSVRIPRAASTGASKAAGSDGSSVGTAASQESAALPARIFDRALDFVGHRVAWGPARLFWWAVWLVFLKDPLAAILEGRYRDGEAVLAATSLILFAALFLAVGWSAFGVAWQRSEKPALAPYLALLAVTIPASLAFGGPWSELFIYLGAATGATLEIEIAIPVLAGLIVAGLAGALTGRWPISDVMFGAFMTAALGVTMLSFRRVVLLVEELRAARAELAEMAVAEERLRFARDLHDVLGHSLSVIALQTQVARRLMRRDPGAAEAALADLDAVAHESLDALRTMVTGYRLGSFSEELSSAQEVLEAAGIRLVVHGSTTPPAGIDELLAWVVREGVTNVIRHSRAHICSIGIEQRRDAIRLEILDDGVGGSIDPNGSGLIGLRERLSRVGGSLEAGPSAGGGFRLTALVPSGTTP
jgi:two-component system, NarL family, sensor histidine kinase DesK